MDLAASLHFLRCPATGQSLQIDESGWLVTQDGRHRYPVVDGSPVLVDDAKSGVFTANGIATSVKDRSEPSRLRLLIRRVLPTDGLNMGASARIRTFVQAVIVTAGVRRPRVLVIGGGEVGEGMTVLLDSPRVDVVQTDVYLSPHVAVACDAHALPLADGSFDGVVVQGVLSLVLDPARVVGELHRVLRDDGVVYAETAFMQQIAEGGYDFTRFTELGHRRLFRMFNELDRGVAVGPAVALLWSCRYFARSLPRNSAIAALIMDKLVTVALFWLKYLDLLLATHRGAGDAAASVYFLGTRADMPVDDVDLVASYRGSVGSLGKWRGNTS